MNKYLKSDLFSTFIITFLGIVDGQITVFYVIYLFWFQELIRTLIDLFFIKKRNNEIRSAFYLREIFSSFFILFIYFVFIIVLFGFMLDWNNKQNMATNIYIFIFSNWYFNLNIIVFAIQYYFYRKVADNTNLSLQAFNHRHIILHVSIIMGAIIQMMLVPKLNLQ